MRPADWEARVAQVLASTQGREGAEVIHDLADLALAAPEADGNAALDRHPDWLARRDALTRLYYEYIVANETDDVARLLAQPAARGARFKELAGEKGRVAYDRVAGMFGPVDFSRCRRFAMIGCGQLPVTALHVMERAAVAECVVLDVSPLAIESVSRLRERFGWDALHPVLCNGKDYDFTGCDVVYVANMVQGKHDTVRRILATAPGDVQLVVREPWSLGRLWAEQAEPLFPPQLEVLGRGPVSRHLSRDLYTRRR